MNLRDPRTRMIVQMMLYGLQMLYQVQFKVRAGSPLQNPVAATPRRPFLPPIHSSFPHNHLTQSKKKGLSTYAFTAACTLYPCCFSTLLAVLLSACVTPTNSLTALFCAEEETEGIS